MIRVIRAQTAHAEIIDLHYKYIYHLDALCQDQERILKHRKECLCLVTQCTYRAKTADLS